jgi:AcrR family transcriptional regulator
MARSVTDNQILEAALEVIIKRGYAGATTREIATAAGINEVTLFRRYGTKEKLLKAVVEQEAKKFAAAGIHPTGNLEADLIRVVQFYKDLMQSRGRVIIAIMNEIPRQPELVEIMQTPLSIFGEVVALIEHYQNAGMLMRGKPMQVCIALIGPLMLERVLASIQPEFSEVAIMPAEHVKKFLNGHALKRLAPSPESLLP